MLGSQPACLPVKQRPNAQRSWQAPRQTHAVRDAINALAGDELAEQRDADTLQALQVCLANFANHLLSTMHCSLLLIVFADCCL